MPTQVTEWERVNCRDPVHLEALDWAATELLEGVQNCSEATLPVPNAREAMDRKVTPGFKIRVKPFKDVAYFWHQVWKSASSPLNCELHTIMKRTRNKYRMEF